MSAKPVKFAYHRYTRYYCIAMDRETRGYLDKQRCQCNTKEQERLFAYLPIVFPPPYCVLRPFRNMHWRSFTLCLFFNSSWSSVRERFARPGWIISTTNCSHKARWRQSRWHLEHKNKIRTAHYTCYIVKYLPACGWVEDSGWTSARECSGRPPWLPEEWGEGWAIASHPSQKTRRFLKIQFHNFFTFFSF